MIFTIEYLDSDGAWKVGQSFTDRLAAFTAYDKALEVFDQNYIRLAYFRSARQP